MAGFKILTDRVEIFGICDADADERFSEESREQVRGKDAAAHR